MYNKYRVQQKTISADSRVTIDYNCIVIDKICILTFNDMSISSDINNGVQFLTNLPKPKKQLRFMVTRTGGTMNYVLTLNTNGEVFMPFAYTQILPSGSYYATPIVYEIA